MPTKFVQPYRERYVKWFKVFLVPDQFFYFTMHSIVENQLENRDPIEVYQFYLAMLKKKCGRHEVIHLISAIFIHLLYRVLKNNESFDIERYKLLLKKYENRKPHKVWALLEEPESPE